MRVFVSDLVNVQCHIVVYQATDEIRIIHHFEPFIDAFQGSFKIQFSYWIDIQLLIKNMVVLSVLDKKINILVSCIAVMLTGLVHSYTNPNKNTIYTKFSRANTAL